MGAIYSRVVSYRYRIAGDLVCDRTHDEWEQKYYTSSIPLKTLESLQQQRAAEYLYNKQTCTTSRSESSLRARDVDRRAKFDDIHGISHITEDRSKNKRKV